MRLFLRPEDFDQFSQALTDVLSGRLPRTFLGYPTHFENSFQLAATEHGPIQHHVEIFTLASFFHSHLGFDPRDGISVNNWLTVPSQRLLEVTAGAVFHDGLGELLSIRQSLNWYPHDVWCYLLACQWGRIGQEEAFVGRTGEVGDDLGSRVVGARLVRDIMRLCFLIERRYAPYSKWLGTAFSHLESAPTLTPSLTEALSAPAWKEREKQLGQAYSAVAERFNALRLTPPLNTSTRLYHDRPFRVLRTERFVDACLAAVEDRRVRSLPLFGSADQFVDSTDLLTRPAALGRLATLYG